MRYAFSPTAGPHDPEAAADLKELFPPRTTRLREGF